MSLSETDREVLVGWMRRRKTAQALALRSRIVLAAAEPDTTNTAIAERLGITTMTVAKWRGRFAEQELDGIGERLSFSSSRPASPTTTMTAR